MIKITKPEISIITRKPIEESDLLRDKSFITYNVDEITKVTLEDDDSGDDVVINFFDSNGRTFFVSQRAYIPLYMATCFIRIDRDDVLSSEDRAEYQKAENEFGHTPSVICSDPRVVWLALVQIWLSHAAPNELRNDATLSEILTDLIPSYDEAIEFLEKNKYPPFVSCYSDIKYAAEKYRGASAKGKRLDYNAYLEENKGWLIEPPAVDWSKYQG